MPSSLTPHLPISPSPHLPISPSPHLPISPSPHLPISPSPHLFLLTSASILLRSPFLQVWDEFREQGYVSASVDNSCLDWSGKYQKQRTTNHDHQVYQFFLLLLLFLLLLSLFLFHLLLLLFLLLLISLPVCGAILFTRSSPSEQSIRELRGTLFHFKKVPCGRLRTQVRFGILEPIHYPISRTSKGIPHTKKRR